MHTKKEFKNTFFGKYPIAHFVLNKEEKMKNLSISIIGFGAAGTSVFVQLIKKLESKKNVDKNLIINIFEKENKLTRGIAYLSDQPSSLLNTKVNRSSIFGDDSSHFFNWVKKNIYTLSRVYPDLSSLSEDSFLPRSLFGMYLDQTFEYYANIAKNLNIKVNILMDEVIDIIEEKSNTFLYTKTGHKVITNKIIFSTGHIYSNRVGGSSRCRPPTPPYVRCRIRRFKLNS